MHSLKGFVLNQFIKSENGAEATEVHRVDGSSLKIGSSFLCHIVLMACKDIHTIISLNEDNQVEIRNYSALNPVRLNGQAVAEPKLLYPGDIIEIVEHKFVWDRREAREEPVDGDDVLEASYQIDDPVNKERCKSEPRVVNHKWVAQRKNNQSIHLGEVSSTTAEGDSDEEPEATTAVEEKENQPPPEALSAASESEGELEAESEKTILKELTEHSGSGEVSCLINLNTPEAPHKTINLIDLTTPGPSRVRTPVRGTPKGVSSTLLKKILDPRMSMTTVESDFDQLSENVHSTPMVDRSQGSLLQRTSVVEMSAINESTELAMESCASDQSTIISNSVREKSVVVAPTEQTTKDAEEEEIPETQPESDLDELFEDAEELAKTLVTTETANLESSIKQDDETVVVDNGVVQEDPDDDDVIPATQMEFRLTVDEEDLLEDPAQLTQVHLEPKLSLVPEEPADGEAPLPDDEMEDEDSPVKESRTFTPRKSMRTPKKIDLDRCCTPKSLSKVLLGENATRTSPRTSRQNLSLRMERTPAPKTPRNLSKSLMVSKLRSVRKSAIKANNKSVVEIPESASEDEEEGEDLDGVVMLADETIMESPSVAEGKAPGTPLILEISEANDSDVIILGSQEASSPALEIIKKDEDGEVESAGNGVTEGGEALEPVTSTVVDNLKNPVEIVEHEESFNTEDFIDEVAASQDQMGTTVNADQVEELVEAVDSAGEDDQVEAGAMHSVVEQVQEVEEEFAPDSTICLPERQEELNVTDRDTPIEATAQHADPQIEQLTEGETSVVVNEMLANPEEIPETPQVDLNDVENESLLRSPARTIASSMIENSPKASSSSSLQKTPKSKRLTDDERVTRSPLQNVSNMVGIRELFKTPKAESEKNYTGLKEMMKTPAATTTVYTATEMVGLREMMKTPGRLFNDHANLVGVKELMKTPKVRPDNGNLVGIKEMLNTPAPQKDVKLLGVRELMQTPVAVTVNTVGVKELFNTPHVAREVNMVGVKELLKTPAVDKRQDLEASEGMAEIFKTPAPIGKVKRVLDQQQEGKAAARELILEEEEAVKEIESAEDEPEIVVKLSIEVTEEEAGQSTEEETQEIGVPSADTLKERSSEIPLEEDKSSTTTVTDETVMSAKKSSSEEEVKLNTSAEQLFDQMMDRKPIRNTYSRKTPAKEEGKISAAESPLSPEKKEEVARWVESIIVTGSGETLSKKPINNNLQILSDRYSNVTPGQGQKAESGRGKREEPVAEEEETPFVEEEIKEITEQPTQPIEEEKPRRGRRPLNKAMAVDEPDTPRTPLRTRRNLKADLEDTPSAVTTPRTRRAASLKLEESVREVKTTPARRGRKPKAATVEEEKKEEAAEELPLIEKKTEEEMENEKADPVENIPIGEAIIEEKESDKQSEDETAKTEDAPRKRGRAKAIKALITEEPSEAASPKATPAKRGRKPKAVELAAEAEAKPATPSRRGRKPAAAKAVEAVVEEKKADAETPQETTTKHVESKTTETPVKRRGRPAARKVIAPSVEETPELVKKQYSVTEEQNGGEEQAPIEDKKEELSVAKPAPRGRRRAAAKVEASESEPASTEAEDAPKALTKPAARGGRGRKAPATTTTTDQSSDVRTATESEDSPTERKVEEPAKPSRGGRKAATAKREEPTTDTDDSPKKAEKPKRGRGAAKKVIEDLKRKVDEDKGDEEQAHKEEASPAKKEKLEETVEEVLVKKPAGRGRKAAVAAQDTNNDSVVSTPGRAKRGGRKAETVKVEEESKSAEVAPAPKRGRGKRAATAESVEVPVESPKRVKKQESETDDGQAVEEEEEEKPKRGRGRAKAKTETEVNESTTKSTTTASKGRGRKATKVTVEEKKEESAESEKETTSEEVTPAPASSRAKRTATKRAATVEDSEHETSRSTRTTRRRN